MMCKGTEKYLGFKIFITQFFTTLFLKLLKNRREVFLSYCQRKIEFIMYLCNKNLLSFFNIFLFEKEQNKQFYLSKNTILDSCYLWDIHQIGIH